MNLEEYKKLQKRPMKQIEGAAQCTFGQFIDIKQSIKPLSVNECWQGQRFKTKKYLSYQQELLYKLPSRKLPKPPYSIYFEFGLSNVLSDWDNPVKPLQDILQKKYGFDDRDIFEAKVKKVKVSKGEEYFLVKIESYEKN